MKSATKNATGVPLQLSRSLTQNANNFPHNLLLNDRQLSSLCKAFANKRIYIYQKFNYPK